MLTESNDEEFLRMLKSISINLETIAAYIQLKHDQERKQEIQEANKDDLARKMSKTKS